VKQEMAAKSQALKDDIAGRIAVVNAQGLSKADQDAAVKKLRAQERERRKKQGKPYHEFVKEWLKKEPKEEIIRSYGPWPDGIR
jgi:translation elongation factor EF-Ts